MARLQLVRVVRPRDSHFAGVVKQIGFAPGHHQYP